MKKVIARCLLCGKNCDVMETHKDFKKITEKQEATFICDLCNNKIRFESDEQRKEKKPI